MKDIRLRIDEDGTFWLFKSGEDLDLGGTYYHDTYEAALCEAIAEATNEEVGTYHIYTKDTDVLDAYGSFIQDASGVRLESSK